MGGVARTVGQQYDLDGNRSRIVHPDGVSCTYELDGLGRPTWVRCYDGDPVTGFTYDAFGRRSTMAWGGIVYGQRHLPVLWISGKSRNRDKLKQHQACRRQSGSFSKRTGPGGLEQR